MFKESELISITQSLEKELENCTKKSSEVTANDLVEYDPVTSELEVLLKRFNEYLQANIKQEEQLISIQEALKEDIQREILDLKFEVEKLPDNSELKKYKNEQILKLNLNLIALDRF